MGRGTDCEDGLLVGEGGDVGIELLACLGLDDHVEKRLRACDNAGWQISNAHFFKGGRSFELIWYGVGRKLCGQHCLYLLDSQLRERVELQMLCGRGGARYDDDHVICTYFVGGRETLIFL